MDGGAWWAAVHGVAKSRTRLRDFTFTFHFHALEKEMAIHSGILAWEIPWHTTVHEGCKTVRHDSELNMEQLTDSKLVEDKAVYCHPAYLISKQSTSCEMPGWMNYKLELSLLGEISGEGNGNPLQYSCLENPRDRGA